MPPALVAPRQDTANGTNVTLVFAISEQFVNNFVLPAGEIYIV
jgi:hypothetical protein